LLTQSDTCWSSSSRSIALVWHQDAAGQEVGELLYARLAKMAVIIAVGKGIEGVSSPDKLGTNFIGRCLLRSNDPFIPLT